MEATNDITTNVTNEDPSLASSAPKKKEEEEEEKEWDVWCAAAYGNQEKLEFFVNNARVFFLDHRCERCERISAFTVGSVEQSRRDREVFVGFRRGRERRGRRTANGVTLGSSERRVTSRGITLAAKSKAAQSRYSRVHGGARRRAVRPRFDVVPFSVAMEFRRELHGRR